MHSRGGPKASSSKTFKVKAGSTTLVSPLEDDKDGAGEFASHSVRRAGVASVTDSAQETRVTPGAGVGGELVNPELLNASRSWLSGSGSASPQRDAWESTGGAGRRRLLPVSVRPR